MSRYHFDNMLSKKREQSFRWDVWAESQPVRRCFVRITLLCVLILTFALAKDSLAEDSSSVVVFESKDVSGLRVEFRTEIKVLSAAPQWALTGDGHDDPPISIAAATKKAREAAARRFPHAEGISFEALEILRRPVSYAGGTLIPSFYVVSMTPIFTNGTAAIRAGSEIKVVVLMDGTLLEATAVK